MIDKWKLALKEFLKEYEEDDNVIGAILYGSYLYDDYDDNSSIDVYLVLKNEANYSEKRVKEYNSYLIKYYMNTVNKIEDNMEFEFDNNLLLTANIFAYGKVIYDLDGSVKKLQDKALCYFDSNFKLISSKEVSYNNYLIWNYLNTIKIFLHQNNIQFNLTYYKLLDKVFNSYLKYLGIAYFPESKIYKILTDKKFKERYHIYKLPEEEFINLYLKCFNVTKTNLMYKNIENLVNYYYKKQGGFNIRTFSIREEL